MPFVRLLAALMVSSSSILLGGNHARAEGEPERVARVTTSALMILEDGATTGDGATVSIGMRRGLAEVEGVRWLHPVDVLSPSTIDEDLQFAIDELEPLIDQVTHGDAEDAGHRADAILALFERNLDAVRREQLIDAHVIAAVARCRTRRVRECEELFQRVVTFREGFEYDSARFPPAYAQVFTRVRNRTLAEARGSLEIRTQPEGAEVYVDGRSYGPAPVTAPDLLLGTHYVTIKLLGFERIAAEARVEGTGSRADYRLTANERSRLVASESFQRVLRSELGEERAGDNLRSLGNTLGAGQVIVGVVRPASDGAIHVQAWLYDVRTRLLLSHGERTLETGEAGMEVARELALELYRGVDLAGAIEAPPELPDERSARGAEVWEEWWFWTAIGAVVVGGAIGIGVGLGTSGGNGVPEGWVRLEGPLP